MHFHNDPSDTIEDVLQSWGDIGSDFTEDEFVQHVEEVRRAEYAALADL